MDREIIHSRLMQLVDGNKKNELRGALLMLNVVDIASFMESLESEKLLMVFRILPKDIAAEVFAYIDSEQQQQLVTLIGDGEIHSLLDEMFLDDAVDFLEELPASVVKRVLQNTDPTNRALINQFLKYPENSAGSIMTIEFAEFHSSMTVRQAMESLRKTGLDKETIYTCYVIDSQRHLVGTVALRHLILADEDKPVSDIMATNFISVKTLDDQEVVADTVRKYDLMSIPVVDNENRLVGIVTADDIMDVIEEENTEDIEKMGGLLPSDDQYLKTPIITLFKNRIPWLLILMISATFTGMIITHFEDVLSDTGKLGVLLTACLPMLMDTGGNCGAQSSTLVIRGLALGEVHFSDILKVWWREARVAMLVGGVLMLVNVGRQLLLYTFTAGVTADTVTVTMVVSVAMFLTVLIAKSIGCTLPLFASKLHLDPALMASPLITTLVDACSLTILFSIATAVMHV